MNSILIDMGALIRSTPTTSAPPGDVATWYDAKAVLLAKIAGAGGTPDEKMLPLAAQARAARQHAAKVRAESPDLELRAHTGAGCLDHTAWGCPVLPESRIAAAA